MLSAPDGGLVGLTGVDCATARLGARPSIPARSEVTMMRDRVDAARACMHPPTREWGVSKPDAGMAAACPSLHTAAQLLAKCNRLINEMHPRHVPDVILVGGAADRLSRRS